MKMAPRFVYNGAVTLNLTLSQMLWEPNEGGGLAGEDEAASGVIESYVVRYDHKVKTTVRFKDSERVAVLTMIEWMVKNKGTAFTFRFDQNDAATAYSMYLVSPKAGEAVTPRRNAEAPWVWELELEMRSVAGTRIHVAYPIG